MAVTKKAAPTTKNKAEKETSKKATKTVKAATTTEKVTEKKEEKTEVEKKSKKTTTKETTSTKTAASSAKKVIESSSLKDTQEKDGQTTTSNNSQRKFKLNSSAPLKHDNKHHYSGNKYYKKRIKFCQLCAKGIEHVDYKDVDLLSDYLSYNLKILSKKAAHNCTSHQRRISNAIKRARLVALIPYIKD